MSNIPENIKDALEMIFENRKEDEWGEWVDISAEEMHILYDVLRDIIDHAVTPDYDGSSQISLSLTDRRTHWAPQTYSVPHMPSENNAHLSDEELHKEMDRIIELASFNVRYSADLMDRMINQKRYILQYRERDKANESG